FAGWATACLTAIDAPGLAKQLDGGFAGLQLPATALADESGYRWCGPLLDVLAQRELPLFIHPGPAGACPMGPGTAGVSAAGAVPAGPGVAGVSAAGAVSAGTSVAAVSAADGSAAGANVASAPRDGDRATSPAWWAALVPYVQQLHAAWFA